MGVVERYLDCIRSHDWEGLAACLVPDVVRVGPFGDSYKGPEYLAFITDLMPRLPGYDMRVDRVVYTGDGRAAFAELSETVTFEGSPHVTPEALVFDLDGDGLIAHIAIYIQRQDPEVLEG